MKKIITSLIIILGTGLGSVSCFLDKDNNNSGNTNINSGIEIYSFPAAQNNYTLDPLRIAMRFNTYLSTEKRIEEQILTNAAKKDSLEKALVESRESLLGAGCSFSEQEPGIWMVTFENEKTNNSFDTWIRNLSLVIRTNGKLLGELAMDEGWAISTAPGKDYMLKNTGGVTLKITLPNQLIIAKNAALHTWDYEAVDVKVENMSDSSVPAGVWTLSFQFTQTVNTAQDYENIKAAIFRVNAEGEGTTLGRTERFSYRTTSPLVYNMSCESNSPLLQGGKERMQILDTGDLDRKKFPSYFCTVEWAVGSSNCTRTATLYYNETQVNI